MGSESDSEHEYHKIIAITIYNGEVSLCMYNLESKTVAEHFATKFYKGDLDGKTTHKMYETLYDWGRFIKKSQIQGIYIQKQSVSDYRGNQLASALFGMLFFATKIWWGYIPISMVSTSNLLQRKVTIPRNDWKSLVYQGDYVRKREEAQRRMLAFIEDGKIQYKPTTSKIDPKDISHNMVHAFLFAISIGAVV